MQKQRPTYNRPPTFGRSILGTKKATVRYPKRIKKIPSESTEMKLPKIKKKLSLIPLLPQISLRFKTPKNVVKANKEIVKPPGSMPPK